MAKIRSARQTASELPSSNPQLASSRALRNPVYKDASAIGKVIPSRKGSSPKGNLAGPSTTLNLIQVIDV